MPYQELKRKLTLARWGRVLLFLALQGCRDNAISQDQAREMANSKFQDYAARLQIAVWEPSPTEEKDEGIDFLFRYRTARGTVIVLVRKTGEVASALNIR